MYAVIDLETTGLWPRRHHRVLEIAVVRVAPDMSTLDEWTTLVNPGRDVGPVSLHGITGGDVVDAPAFADVASEVACRLSGSVLVAHNLPFDSGFLQEEFARLGIALPEARGLCTLDLACRVRVGGGRTLENCCRSLGLDAYPDHSALADARAAAALLGACATELKRRGEGLPPHEPLFFNAPPATNASGHVYARGSRRNRESPLRDLLASLPARAAAVDSESSAVVAYADLLDHVLEDRRVSSDEVDALAETATLWHLGQRDVEDIHRSYMTSLIGMALADGRVTDQERADIERVAALLGLVAELPALVAASEILGDDKRKPDRRSELAGLSVCFTGESVCSIGGHRFDRARQEMLAAEAGLVVAPRVTKKLDVLVLADPDSRSGKARTARQYGTRLIAERAFWIILGVSID